MTRVVQEHMKLIKKFPHRIQTPYQRVPDLPFDPSPSWGYKTSKQVEW